jgi:serine/threonine protein phosphatase PrpC
VGDSWRVNGNLAVSRALGDFVYKQNELVSQTNQAVTALPEIMSHELAEGDVLLMMACDGIWDVMSNDDMSAFLQTKLTVNPPPPPYLLFFHHISMNVCLKFCCSSETGDPHGC